MFYAKTPDDLPSIGDILSLTGEEFMQGILDGTISGPPIAHLMNFRMERVEKGSVTFTGTPKFEVCNPIGTVHGGWYGTILDSAMACSVQTLLPKGRFYTTLEYKVNITRALPVGATVTCRGLVQHFGRSTAVANAEIRGEDDNRLYATGSTTCLVMAPPQGEKEGGNGKTKKAPT